MARYGLPPDRPAIPLGHPQADSILGGGLRPGALHEVFAGGWSASGFAALLAIRAAGAKPLFWVLDQLHKVIQNWGWSIVMITFLLKLVFYPLSETSGKSMAKMRVLAPRIKNLQDTYKDDREKLGKAMMEVAGFEV